MLMDIYCLVKYLNNNKYIQSFILCSVLSDAYCKISDQFLVQKIPEIAHCIF